MKNRKKAKVIIGFSILSITALAGCIYGNFHNGIEVIDSNEAKSCIGIIDWNVSSTNEISEINEVNLAPIHINSKSPENISWNLFSNNKQIEKYNSNKFPIFSEKYSFIEGVLTFRGDNLRTSPAFGKADIKDKKLKQQWYMETSSSTWGGGAGWTGQPSIIRWPEDVKAMMNIKPEYKAKKDFVEVVYASLDGNVYFLDLYTGKRTREPIKVYNPIKGSVALDPRGYPLLYVGQGISEKGKIGYRIFNLINGEEMYFINGLDSKAYRQWGAFDSSPIIDKNKDIMILCGENGLVYNIKLNTKFDKANKKVSINPEIIKYRYKISGNGHQGIENSVSAYRNLAYFADNGGSIQCLNLQKMKPLWTFNGGDDTDATITIDIKDNVPYIYTANEVDKQGTRGKAYLRKINGLNGKVIFEKPYEAMSLLGNSPVNGGVLATNVIGKNTINDLVIFNVARYKKFNSGLLVALNKETGKEVWKFEMPNYCWSSPVDVYDPSGKAYLIQGDSIGNLYLIEGKTGVVLDTINLGSNIESSPAVFNDTLVLATRGGKVFGVKIK